MSGGEKDVVFVVKVGEKEIVIDENTLSIVHEYIKTPMSLEELAERLRLESWEEAYEFIKALPAWIMWTPPSLWKHRTRWISEKLTSRGKKEEES